MESYLKVASLTKEYGYIPALKDISFDIEKNTFLAILGPNGAGKTTLLRSVCGLIRPTSGEVLFKGENVREEFGSLKEGLGYLSHDTLLYDNLTAYQNMKFFASLHGISGSQRIKTLLKRVGILERAHDDISDFSRGMKQRTSIARSILHDPELMILDEPFSGLDQEGKEDFRTLFKELHREKRTIIMTTHNFEHVPELSTRICILKDGKQLLTQSTSSLPDGELKDTYREVCDKE